MQVLEDPSLLPEEESSYHEDDSIDLNTCFDALEQHITKQHKLLMNKLASVNQENSRLRDDLETRDEQLRASQAELQRVAEDMEAVKLRVEENDREMRRQIENAAAKVRKYKERIAQKSAEVEELNAKIMGMQEEEQESENQEPL